MLYFPWLVIRNPNTALTVGSELYPGLYTFLQSINRLNWRTTANSISVWQVFIYTAVGQARSQDTYNPFWKSRDDTCFEMLTNYSFPSLYQMPKCSNHDQVQHVLLELLSSRKLYILSCAKAWARHRIQLRADRITCQYAHALNFWLTFSVHITKAKSARVKHQTYFLTKVISFFMLLFVLQ